jgi:MFS family permease
MLVYLSLAEYVSRNANKNLKTRGQMMNFIVLGGPSAIIGSSAGGFISKIVGLNYTFLICSIISFISVIGFIIVIKILPDFKSRQVLNSQSS